MGSHYGTLHRVAYLLTGDNTAADDLVQDTLIRAWSYSRDTAVEQPLAFVRRCMVNLYISQGRRKFRSEVPTSDSDLLDRTASQPRDLAQTVTMEQVVWQALKTLPRHQRALLVLRFYEDMSESQVAALLGVGVGSVRSGTWRALRRLRTLSTLMEESRHV